MIAHYIKCGALWAVTFIVTACVAPISNKPAPVEERGRGNYPHSVSIHAKDGADTSKRNTLKLPSQVYLVQKGDTLFSIAFSHGLDYRGLAQLNNIDDPALIKIGQQIKLSLEARVSEESEVSAKNPVNAKFDKTQLAPTVDPEEDGLDWGLPAKGAVIAEFSESAYRKGIDIAGKLGSPIVASAAGKVVYCGSGLRGYGKLVIIKHNKLFLSAYAHNDQLLVKEGQTVTKGQKIAEMGNTDTDQIKLHFEIRKLGKPVDPAQYLAVSKP